MTLHDEIDRMDATYLPPWQRRRTNATRFGPHVLPMLEREYGVGVFHQPVLPQFPLYFGADDEPAVRGNVDYVVFARDCARAIFVHCVGRHAGHNMRQLSFYDEVRDAGVHDVLGDVARRFRELRDKRGLFVLLYLLQTMNLLRLPADLMTEMAMPRPRGVAELAQGIEVVAPGGMQVSQFEIHEPDLG